MHHPYLSSMSFESEICNNMSNTSHKSDSTKGHQFFWFTFKNKKRTTVKPPKVRLDQTNIFRATKTYDKPPNTFWTAKKQQKRKQKNKQTNKQTKRPPKRQAGPPSTFTSLRFQRLLSFSLHPKGPVLRQVLRSFGHLRIRREVGTPVVFVGLEGFYVFGVLFAFFGKRACEEIASISDDWLYISTCAWVCASIYLSLRFWRYDSAENVFT